MGGGFVKVVLLASLILGLSSSGDPEARIVAYLKEHVRPGEPVIVSDLYNRVFTAPEERAVLSRLFDGAFKVPLFVVEFQKRLGRLPSLRELSEQFGFRIPGEADLVLRILEVDPRVPNFLTRDRASGEIRSVDVDAVLRDPLFGKNIDRALGGSQGRPAPQFSIQASDGVAISSSSLAGKPYLLYFWFSNCPPCMQTAPMLVDLHKAYPGLEIVGVNADRVLELPYTDDVRGAYVRKVGMTFRLAYLTTEMQEAYGMVSVFPTLVFVDRKGIVVKELVSLPSKGALEDGARLALG